MISQSVLNRLPIHEAIPPDRWVVPLGEPLSLLRDSPLLYAQVPSVVVLALGPNAHQVTGRLHRLQVL